MTPDSKNGPPGEEARPRLNPAAAEPSVTDDAAVTNALQLRRRRAASLRLPPLDGGRRDPWPTEPLGVSQNEVLITDRAARRTWHHLRALGLLSEHVETVLAASIVDVKERAA